MSPCWFFALRGALRGFFWVGRQEKTFINPGMCKGATTTKKQHFDTNHKQNEMRQEICIEPDPIATKGNFQIVTSIDSIPTTLRDELSSLLGGPSSSSSSVTHTAAKSVFEPEEEGSLSTLTYPTEEYTPVTLSRSETHFHHTDMPSTRMPLLYSVTPSPPRPPSSSFLQCHEEEEQFRKIETLSVKETAIRLQDSPQPSLELRRPTLPMSLDNTQNTNNVKTNSTTRSVKLSELQQTRWLEHFRALCEYKMKHGHSNVPTTGLDATDDISLALWVKRVRHEYKLYQRGRRSSLTPERVELLRGIDFRWKLHDDSWSARFSELQEFVEKQGHVRVPVNEAGTSCLYHWIKRQRRHYDLYLQGKPSSMSHERYIKLRDVGLL